MVKLRFWRKEPKKKDTKMISQLAGLLRRRNPQLWNMIKARAIEQGMKVSDYLESVLIAGLQNADPETYQQYQEAMQQAPTGVDGINLLGQLMELTKGWFGFLAEMTKMQAEIAANITSSAILQQVKAVQQVMNEIQQGFNQQSQRQEPEDELGKLFDFLNRLRMIVRGGIPFGNTSGQIKPRTLGMENTAQAENESEEGGDEGTVRSEHRENAK